ncbi:hypothetical protein N7509_008179 [Penicillium cosmopolitanum]|uniref:Uncharacterized protein n=1 Tax=Penicillium cosmopolitanum TaxID=1131564 RepID=A0A9X0B2D0_9EURO|nr:uncharacterized protein N7509_008179 [Penicillium cosmopolitanum]KAJ5385638.1 hypothetical protein N7509_008179 [Penicillium cosmopolitanum]
MSKFAHKAEEGFTGHPESIRSSNYRPHDLNLANKVDPCVDSDRDNASEHGAIGRPCGLHDTSIANQLGPRVHCDNGRKNAPDYYHLDLAKYYGHGGTACPPNSIIANKLDPPLDLDRVNEALAGSSLEISGARIFGRHNTDVANKLNLHVDSDVDESGL